MTPTTQSPTSEPLDVTSPTALAYEATEEARLLLDGGDGELEKARTAAGEAAYYLSDTIEPDDRVSLLAFAERRSPPHPGQDDERTAEALSLLADAASEVEEILRGPNASSELRIGLRALRAAIGSLAGHFGLATNNLDLDTLRSRRPSALRKLRAKRR